jgi:hypothetical protein
VIGGITESSSPTDVFVSYGPTGAQLGLLDSSMLTTEVLQAPGAIISLSEPTQAVCGRANRRRPLQPRE